MSRNARRVLMYSRLSRVKILFTTKDTKSRIIVSKTFVFLVLFVAQIRP
jgi:hypothetical protein